jgi:ElaB/YqjD/DUF883 family membrane-anchored ribosome-binding protein
VDAVQDVAEKSTDEMRDEIDSTRTELADKLEALEDQVMGTVQSAKETVEDSIQIAKDTVATVKRTFDIKAHVEKYPWPMVGGCVLAGLALGALVQRMLRPSRQTPDRPAGSGAADHRSNDSFAATAPPPFQAATTNGPGFFDQFHEEIAKVKGIGISYVMGLARDALKDSVPQVASQIDEVMNGFAIKLGGAPAA